MRATTQSVLRLAVPSILANITIPLVGIVDVAIIGHISDAAAVGGIAVGTMLFDLLYWNFGFLRVGTSGLTAQAFGRGDRDEQRSLLQQSVGLAMLGALLCLAIQWLFVTAVLAVMPCSAEVADFARRYFFVRIWAAPATLSLMALKGWFIGMQNTVAPMVTDIVVNVVNMVASYVLAVKMQSPIGVAWGTLIAQYTGLLTAVGILTLRYRGLDCLQGVGTSLRWSSMRRLVTLSSNLFIRSLCFMVVYVGYTTIASRYGDTELAVSAILMKLFMFFSYFVDGFAYAGEALTGKEGATPTGWQRTDSVNRVVRELFVWATGVGVVFTVLYALGADWLIALMTSDAVIRAAAQPYYIWLALMPIISSLAFMWDGVYVGAAAAVPVRNCMIWAAVSFVLIYLVSFRFLPLCHALYLAYFAHLLARTVYLTLRWR